MHNFPAVPGLLGTMLLLFAALACQIGPSPAPTPGPVSIDGVEQLTQDFAFYREVMWSPRGDWIAARRCPILLGRPECNGSDETIVIIEPDSTESQTLRLTLDGEDASGGFPIAWSRDGTRLLVGVGRVLTADEAPIPFHEYSYAAYWIDTGDLERLGNDFYPIGWNPAGTAILVETIRAEAVVSIGWFSFEASEFEEVLKLENQEEFLGPYVVSPNGDFLLQTDSNLPESCDKVRRNSLQSVGQFESFLTLACFPSWSSDGSKLAYASKDTPQSLPSQIIIANSDGSDPRTLFPGQQLGEVSFPTWSPGGKQIAFVRSSGGGSAIYVADVPEEMRP